MFFKMRGCSLYFKLIQAKKADFDRLSVRWALFVASCVAIQDEAQADRHLVGAQAAQGCAGKPLSAAAEADERTPVQGAARSVQCALFQLLCRLSTLFFWVLGCGKTAAEGSLVLPRLFGSAALLYPFDFIYSCSNEELCMISSWACFCRPWSADPGGACRLARCVLLAVAAGCLGADWHPRQKQGLALAVLLAT